MKKLLCSLLAVSSLAFTGASAEIYGNRTFLAHRENLNNIGMSWANHNHYTPKKDGKKLGATLSATGFYRQSNNPEDIAKVFGMGEKGADTTGKLTVDASSIKDDISTFHTVLTRHQVDHAPTDSDLAASGDITLSPQLSSYGVRLDWEQSLDNLVKGLRLRVAMPLEEVNTRTIKDASALGNNVASTVGTSDGVAGSTVLDYFTGELSKDIATHSSVSQAALNKGLLSHTKQSVTGIGDVLFNLDLDLLKKGRCSLVGGVSAVLPTGTSSNGKYLFEAVTGNRGHIGLGANLSGVFQAFSKGKLSVALHAKADWKHFFKGTEARMLGVYDSVNNVNLPGGAYRLAMQNSHSGVFPLANVAVRNISVTPGHQFEGLVGLSGTHGNFTFDIGYNFFAKEKETVTFKEAWSDDTYAFADEGYDMSTANESGKNPAADNIGWAPATKSQHLIGAGAKNNDLTANGSAYHAANHTIASTFKHQTTERASLISGAGAAGVSVGLVQSAGITTSALSSKKGYEDGVVTDDSGNQTARYQVTTAPAVTEAQMTHSIVGGASYKLKGSWPVVLSAGGQYEFIDSSRNSSVAGWQVWGGVGICF